VITVTIKFLGGLREEMGTTSTTISLPQGATLRDLEPHLQALGLEPDSAQIIVTLNNRGLRQWPPDRRFTAEDVVAVFPHISGGRI
jgi:molybdopterin converting factor small subunit